MGADLAGMMREPPRPGCGGVTPEEATWWRLDIVNRRLADAEAALRKVARQQKLILATLADLRRPPKVARPQKGQMRLPLERMDGSYCGPRR